MVPTRPTCHAERGRLKTERENARCQGCRGATRKAAKHARRRLRQALLSPGMGLRAHACAWSWTRREVGEDAVGQWGPRKHPTPTETRQGRSTAGCGQALVRAPRRPSRESSLPSWAKGEDSDLNLAVLLCGAGRRNHLGYAGASRPERRSTRPGDVLPRKGKKVQGVHGPSTGADGRWMIGFSVHWIWVDLAEQGMTVAELALPSGQ